MDRGKMIEPIGFVVGGITFVYSMILFYLDNSMFFGSLFAAIIAGMLAWCTYIVLRWVLLAIRKEN